MDQGGRERSWSTTQHHGPARAPGPLLINLNPAWSTSCNHTPEIADQGGSRWTGRTTSTMELGVGPGALWSCFYILLIDMSPKRTTPVTDCKPMICFLQGNHKDNEYFDTEDMGRHPKLRKEHVLMSSAIISQVETRNFDAEFISKVITASKKDQEWQKRLTELIKLRE